MGATVASVGSNGLRPGGKARLGGRVCGLPCGETRPEGRRCRFHSMSAGGTLKGVLRLAEA